MKIESFKVGDIFCSKHAAALLILNSEYANHKYVLAGLNGLRLYSNGVYHNEESLLKYLNSLDAKLMGNINDKVAQTLSFFNEEFQKSVANEIQIPEGWQELKTDDTIKTGDKYFNCYGNNWLLVSGSIGLTYANAKIKYPYMENFTVIRLIGNN